MSKKTRKPIEMTAEEQCSFKDIFELFVAAKTAKGVEEVTIRNYYYRLKTVQRWLDITRPFNEITKAGRVNTVVVKVLPYGMAVTHFGVQFYGNRAALKVSNRDRIIKQQKSIYKIMRYEVHEKCKLP